MATANLTRSQVFTAADQISAAGQQPTVASVRAKLGTGSYTTITAMLREWRDQATPAREIDIEVPEEITQALGRAAEIVWKAAQNHFQHELATVKKDAARQVAEAQEAEASAVGEIVELEGTLQATVEELAQADKTRKELAEELKQMALDIAGYQAEIKANNARIKEQAELLRRMSLQPTAAAATSKARPRKPTPAKDATMVEAQEATPEG